MHFCIDSCWASRIAEKYKTTCSLCGSKCNAKCLGIKDLSFIAMLSSTSNTLIFCDKCLADITNYIRIVKGNGTTNTNSTPAPSMERNSNSNSSQSPGNKSKQLFKKSNTSTNETGSLNKITPQPNKNKDNKDILETKLNKFNDILIKIEQTMENKKINDQTIETKIENILTQILEKQSAYDTNLGILTNDTTKMLAQLNKVASLENLKNVAANICSSIEKHCAEASNKKKQNLSHSFASAPKPNDILDWSLLNDSTTNGENLSMDGRQSFIVKQSVDDNVMEILKNSEKLTWESLDIMGNKVDRNTEILESIQSEIEMCSSKLHARSTPNAHTIQSPLSNLVTQETLSNILEEISTLSKAFTNMAYTPKPPAINLTHSTSADGALLDS